MIGSVITTLKKEGGEPAVYYEEKNEAEKWFEFQMFGGIFYELECLDVYIVFYFIL